MKTAALVSSNGLGRARGEDELGGVVLGPCQRAQVLAAVGLVGVAKLVAEVIGNANSYGNVLVNGLLGQLGFFCGVFREADFSLTPFGGNFFSTSWVEPL